jgi:hypothetical protein
LKYRVICRIIDLDNPIIRPIYIRTEIYKIDINFMASSFRNNRFHRRFLDSTNRQIANTTAAYKPSYVSLSNTIVLFMDSLVRFSHPKVPCTTVYNHNNIPRVLNTCNISGWESMALDSLRFTVDLVILKLEVRQGLGTNITVDLPFNRNIILY